MRRLALLAATALLLAGCGSDKLDGDVTNKDVRPGYTYVQIMPMCTPSGNTTICYPIPYIFTVPTCYRLAVRTLEGKIDDGCIDQDRWDNVSVGQHYTGKDLGDRKSKKEQ